MRAVLGLFRLGDNVGDVRSTLGFGDGEAGALLAAEQRRKEARAQLIRAKMGDRTDGDTEAAEDAVQDPTAATTGQLAVRCTGELQDNLRLETPNPLDDDEVVERVPFLRLDTPGDRDALGVLGPASRAGGDAGKNSGVGHALVLLRRDALRSVPGEGVRSQVGVGEVADGGADFAVRFVVVRAGPVGVPHRVAEGNEITEIRRVLGLLRFVLGRALVLLLVSVIRLSGTRNFADEERFRGFFEDLAAVKLPELLRGVFARMREEDFFAACISRGEDWPVST